MELEVKENGTLKFTKVYTGFSLESKDGETMSICMRDSGFEFNYNGTWYSAKNGIVEPLKK